MANAISRRRRAYESDIEDGEVVETGAPYELSRSAMRSRYGSRRIDATATPSPRNAGATPGVMGGFTDQGAWDAFFHKGRPSLAPTTPVDATGMAETQSSMFNPRVPFVPMKNTPDSLFSSAVKEHEAWFDAQGMSIPSPSGPRLARSGDRFSSKYGTGSVTNGLSVDASRKLALLGVDDDLF